MKKERNCLKFSICEKWLHENYTIFSGTCIDCGHNNRSTYLEKRTKSTKKQNESHSDTEHRLFYLITVMFTTCLLFYIALYVGHLSPRICQRRSSACDTQQTNLNLLQRYSIFCSTDHTIPTPHQERQFLLEIVKLCKNRNWGIVAHLPPITLYRVLFNVYDARKIQLRKDRTFLQAVTEIEFRRVP